MSPTGYWPGRLADAHDRVDLAPGVPRPPVPGARRWVAATGSAAPVELLAALAVLLHRYTGTTDVVLALAGADVPATRVRVDPAAPRAALAAALAADLAEARRHPVPTPAELAALTGGTRLPILVGFADGDAGSVLDGELVVAARPGTPVRLGHDPALLPAALVTALAADLGRLLAADPTPDAPVGTLLSEPAYARAAPVDHAAAHGAGPLPPPTDPADLETSVAVRFGAIAARHPELPALLTADGPVSYAELAARAGAVAAALRGAGLAAGGRVGLLVGHGAGTVAAILGVLAAGGCYVPLDPDYPADRLAVMARVAEPAVLLADAAHRADAEAFAAGRPVLVLDHLPPADWPAHPAGGPDGPAYLLFTSGSTGLPKAVTQNQRNLLYGALNHARSLRAGTADRMSVLSSFSFDMAVTDLFSALLTGAAAVPVDVRATGLAGLADALRRHGVTVYHSTPTVYRYLLDCLGPDGRLPAVRAVLLGGEEVVADDVRRCRAHLAPDCVFINGYGATEVSFAVQHHLPATAAAPTAVVPIGTPLPGLRVELTDAAGRATALTGEITVTGRHVALGYRAGADAGRFTDHGDGTRTYRTGDLARRLPDGALAYLGRRDRQVKIRGYRVELGEVEAALAEVPGVARAVVVADRPVAGAEARLTGYLLAATGADLDVGAVRAALAGRLPHYLVPAPLVRVEGLPLTPTGKVDTAALPPSDAATTPVTAAEPPTGTAATVAAAWRAELRLDSVGLRQHFFDLGGHSLLLARVHRRLETQLRRSIPLTSLFEHPTVESLAAWLDTGDAPARAPATRAADRADRRRSALARRTRQERA